MANQAKEQNDATLVSRTCEGDDDSFSELLRRYQRPVLNFVYRLLGNETEAEDVAQETFVRAYQHLADFDPRRKFSTWLFALARNAAIDRLRYRQRHPTEELSDIAAASLARGPADEAATREIGDEIAAAIQSLSEDQRTAIVLAEYHDLSYAEIAEIMDCSVKSVESRLYRAKAVLREKLRGLF